MVKLQTVLRSRVVKCNGEVRTPVLCSSSPESQEHCLEKCAALVSAFEFIGGNIQAPDLQTQSLDQLIGAAALPESRQILVEQGFARSTRIAALGVRDQHPK